MKKAILKAFSLMLVAVCLTACSNNNGKNDKEVTTTVATNHTTLTTTAPVETTTETPTTVVTTTTAEETTISEVTTPPQTSETKTKTSTTTEKETTVTTTTTTKKKTTTTTTTKKKTTTTAKTTTKKVTTTTAVKGKTMWISQMSGCYEINGDSWKQISGVYADWGEKVTAYETVTVYEGYKFTRCKFSDGTYTYIRVDDLRTTDPAITDDPLPDGYMHKFTQEEIDRLAEYTKQYAISRGVTWDDSLTKENSSWSGDYIFYEYDLFFDYDIALEKCEEMIDYYVEGWGTNGEQKFRTLGICIEKKMDTYCVYPVYWEFYILR